MQLNLKALTESTIGKAREINQRAITENRELTAAEQSSFDALLGAYRVATGKQVPGDKNGFANFCNSPSDGFTSDQLAGSTLQPMTRGVTLFDENGVAHRGLTKDESFASAVRERSSLTRQPCGENFASDGLGVGDYLRSMVTGPRNNVELAALNTGGGGSGGYTVPEYLAAELIDRFRAKMVLSKLGALTIPMSAQTHSFAKLLTDPVPTWRQELTSIAESEPTFGGITLTARSLAVEVRCSRELLQDSLNIGQAIERSLTEAFAREVDRVGMFGLGSAAEPMGLTVESGVNAVTSVGTPANYTKILDGYKLLLDDNAPDPTGLIMSPREWRTFAGFADTTNQPMMKPPAIENLPFEATSACTDGTMLMGYFPDFAFGMRAELQIEVLKEYHALTHEYGFVAHLRMDTACFHPESFCKLTGVTSA